SKKYSQCQCSVSAPVSHSHGLPSRRLMAATKVQATLVAGTWPVSDTVTVGCASSALPVPEWASNIVKSTEPLGVVAASSGPGSLPSSSTGSTEGGGSADFTNRLNAFTSPVVSTVHCFSSWAPLISPQASDAVTSTSCGFLPPVFSSLSPLKSKLKVPIDGSPSFGTKPQPSVGPVTSTPSMKQRTFAMAWRNAIGELSTIVPELVPAPPVTRCRLSMTAELKLPDVPALPWMSVMVTVGAWRSTTKVQVLWMLGLPNRSLAKYSTVWLPSAIGSGAFAPNSSHAKTPTVRSRLLVSGLGCVQLKNPLASSAQK